MDSFTVRHRDKIVGTLSCFDRLIFRGHLPIDHTRGLQALLDQRGILFKDLKSFMARQADRLKAHAEELAKDSGRPFRDLPGPARKEALARDRRGRWHRRGSRLRLLDARAVPHVRLAYGQRRPRLLSAHRPRSRRWRVTDRGRLLMSAALLIHDEHLLALIAQRVA